MKLFDPTLVFPASTKGGLDGGTHGKLRVDVRHQCWNIGCVFSRGAAHRPRHGGASMTPDPHISVRQAPPGLRRLVEALRLEAHASGRSMLKSSGGMTTFGSRRKKKLKETSDSPSAIGKAKPRGSLRACTEGPRPALYTDAGVPAQRSCAVLERTL